MIKDPQTPTRRVCKGGARLGPQWKQCLCKGELVGGRDVGRIPELAAHVQVALESVRNCCIARARLSVYVRGELIGQKANLIIDVR